MNKIEHVYLELEGDRYNDYTIYTEDNLWWSNYYTGNALVSSSLETALTNESGFDRLCTKCYVPKKGDEIYVAPGCKYAIEDIRKNYKLKRDPNSASCCVFSPLNNRSTYVYSCSDFIIFPDLKTIVISDDFNDASRSINISTESVDNYTVVHACVIFYSMSLKPAYIALLKGEINKPIVNSRDLDISSNNQLDIDVLQLVYEAGKQDWDTENEKNAVIQYNVLNQHNWREYPGTISILNELILNKKAIGNTMMCQKSRYSKPVKEILSHPLYQPFVSDNDRKLAADFVGRLMGITDTKYVGITTLLEKLKGTGLSVRSFENMFTTICKIHPWIYDQN